MGLYATNGITSWGGKYDDQARWPESTRLVNILTGEPAGTIGESRAKTQAIVAEARRQAAAEAGAALVEAAVAAEAHTAAALGSVAAQPAEVAMPVPVPHIDELASAVA